MKLKQVVPFSLNLWTTTEASLKRVQQFLKERNFSGVYGHIFTPQVVKEVLELRGKQGLFSLLIIDEGQIEEFKHFFPCKNTLFLVLSSGFANEYHSLENLIFIDSLDELFELFGQIYDRASDCYRAFLLETGQQNLKSFIRYTSSHDFDEQVKLMSEAQKVPFQVLHEQLVSGDFSILKLLEGIGKENIILSEYRKEFLEHSRFESLIHLPLFSIVEKEMALFLPNGDLNFDQCVKLKMILSYYRFLNNTLGDMQEEELVLKYFPFPLTVIDRGDVIFYNQKFLELNISSREILKIGPKESLNIDETSYSLQRVELEGPERELFIFIPYLVQEKEKNISSKELGIITSSIAHELNNPLAGIMSAVTVLEYEDFWSEQDREYLEDIKITTQRSKKIVETFLGFSRSALPSEKECSLCELLEQSLELIRFRSAELDVRLVIDMDHCRDKALHVPGPIFTMFLYLLYSEVLTLVNHEKLIDQRGVGEHFIRLVASATVGTISLHFPDLSIQALNKMEQFVSHSKLIEHLLSLLKMKFLYEQDERCFQLEEIL